MGNQQVKIPSSIPKDKRRTIQHARRTQCHKPGDGVGSFIYIQPVALDDDCDEIQDEKSQLSSQTSSSIHQAEYASMEQSCQNSFQKDPYPLDIKIKRDHFIKMKNRNYLDDYQIIKEIGRGGFGVVKKVKSKYINLFRAAKIIKKSSLSKEDHQRLLTEITIMKKLDHINIIKLYEVYDYKSHYTLILQLCEGGELFKKIFTTKKMPEQFVAQIIKQILKVLLYLNHLGVVHRDLKPENMLFQKETQILKIIDFGIACEKKVDSKLSERVGTPYYIAPEVLLKEYDQKCDIWSTGIIMYMMMTHKPPFKGDSQLQIMKRIIDSEPAYKLDLHDSKYSKQCQDLLKNMLIKNPKIRISVHQAFQHPWIKDVKENSSVLMSNEKEIIESIQNFGFKNKLQAVIYTFIVSQVLTTPEKIHFIQVFDDIDTDHNGVISSQQFYECLKLKSKIQQDKIHYLLNIIDTNDSSEIDLTEFIVACLKMKNIIKKHHFEQAYAYFDIDHSGAISYEEIAFFLDDQSGSFQTIKDIFKQVDKDNDGVISKQQFIQLLMKNIAIKS